MSGRRGLRSALCVLAFIVPPRFAAADVLGPWAAGPATNGYWLNNGIAGGHGHLYTITSIGAEASAIQPDDSPGPWAGTASPNLARALAITLATDGAVYIAGGHTGTDPAAGTATVEVAPIQVDGSLGPWQYTSSMTVARTNHAGALGAGRLYMLGNYGGSNSVESVAILPDGTLGLWRAETAMNQSRERPGAAVVNNFLYALGGLPFTTSVERAPIGSDGVLGAWAYVAPMQEARYELGAAAIGALLFAVAGYNDTQGGFASVEVSDFTGDGFGAWSFTSPLPSPYWNANATAVGNALYVVGATEQYSGPTDKSVEFAAASPSTTSSTTTTTTLLTSRCPQSEGSWKTHPAAWPVTTLKLGIQIYSQVELLAILGTPAGTGTKADASLILADQLIAAKLNLAHGSDPSPVSSTVADADSLFSTFPGKLPYKVSTSSTIGKAMIHDADVLDSYNSGRLTPNCAP